MTYLLAALGAGLLLLVWDFQRRWFQNQSKQRDHEQTREMERGKRTDALISKLDAMADSQKARDERNDRALANFVNEMKQGITQLTALTQKQSSAQVEKLQQMSRLGRR